MISSELWKGSWSAAIVNHLWQSTLVMLVAWLLTLALKRNQARTRYWVWMAASVKLLVPFSFLAVIGDWLRPTTIHPLQSPQLASAMAQVAHPFLQASQAPDSLTIVLSTSPVAPASQQSTPLPAIIAAVWLCGSLFLLLRWWRDWRKIRRTLESATRIYLPLDVPAFSTPRRIEPGIVGIFRPALLLPEKILDQLSPAQLRSILAHESCHVRRRDNLTAAIHMTVEAIFWFHPGVWWIERRLIEERERACDEAVLELGNEAEVYAEGILNVCKLYTESPIACIAGVTGAELKQRIGRIMTNHVCLKLDLGRKVLLSAVATAAIAFPVAFGMLHVTEVRAQSAPANARSIAGTWQGILHNNRDWRWVLKITTGSDGTLRTMLYNIDAQPNGTPAMSTKLSGSLLQLELPFGTYAGTVSADGDSIKGVWKNSQNAVPLNFTRATPATEWTIPHPQRLPAMAADADPTFEVATIKPAGPDEQGTRVMINGRHFSTVRTTLSDLTFFAYGVQKGQILGAPDWFTSERYDISAEPDRDGVPSPKQWQSMVQKLLADRFQVKLHYEKRELPVFALTVGKTGPKLTSSQADPNGSVGLGFGPPGNFGATNATMADVAKAMAFTMVDRPVVDQTGLAGKYDLRLTWTPDGTHSATDVAYAPPDLFTAIQEQLGLKLVPTKAPVDVLVIDRVERPSAN